MMTRVPVEWAKRLLKRFPRVANYLRRIRDERMVRIHPRPTKHGFVFAGPPGMMDGTFEPVETRMIRDLLGDADVFVNVGANVGYYVCHALSLGKGVLAVEPMRANLACLYRNLKANGWTRGVEVFPMALSDVPGIVEIYGSGTGASLVAGWAGAPSAASDIVPAATLDALLGDRFEGRRVLILADVEGAEWAMLRGATRALRRRPSPVMMIEINVTEHQPGGVRTNPRLEETFECLWHEGYEAWTVEPKPRKIVANEVHAIARSGLDTLGVHNFIFRKEGPSSRAP